MSAVPQPSEILRRMFDAAVAEAPPAGIVAYHLPAPPNGRTIVPGAGKASAAMARAVEDSWTLRLVLCPNSGGGSALLALPAATGKSVDETSRAGPAMR